MRIQIESGDISSVPSQSLITLLNPAGAWIGAIDARIRDVSGNHFHDQALIDTARQQCDTIIAIGGSSNDAAFENVTFVIDGLHGPLRDVIMSGLQASADAGFESATLPAMRMGVTLGVVEKDRRETVEEIAKGVRSFLNTDRKNLENITFVIHNDETTLEFLKDTFKRYLLI